MGAHQEIGVGMRVLLVTDAYFPTRTSVAILLYELAQTFLEEGKKVSIVVPSASQTEDVIFSSQEGCQIITVKALQTKDVNYLRRTVSEFLNPWLMWRLLKKNPDFMQAVYLGVIWYSPSIFWGPLIKQLKGHFRCGSYLILRDLFPDWALHLGLLRNGLTYRLLKRVERYQYAQADTIGVQSPNNLLYFKKNYPQVTARLEVLWNWARPQGSTQNMPSPIVLEETPLQGRIIFVYAGNLGVAQGIPTLLRLIEALNNHPELGFLIVGRGSEKAKIEAFVAKRQLSNTVVCEEIDPFAIAALFKQCHAGLLFLDHKHRTHNIPGKLVAYLQSGLPVFAVVNPGNDLIELIPRYQIGEVDVSENIEALKIKVLSLVRQIQQDSYIQKRARDLANTLFNAKAKAQQILAALEGRS